MKTKQIGVWVVLMIVVFTSSLFLFSCSRKKIKTEGVVPPVSSSEDEAEKAKKRVRIREQDQELREKALREEEARRLREAAVKAQFETEDVYFTYDQYDLSETAKQTLDKKAQWLKDFPMARVSIEGHCDERGSTEYNLALGQRRADAAMQYLISLGIGANRISTISYGKEKPLETGQNEEAWARNRRDHFVLK